MPDSNELALAEKSPLASSQLASFLGIDKGMMIDTIKAQCFKNTTPDKISDEQLASFISVANALRINPLLPGFLYAYPERNGGITPIIGPDGIFKLLSSHPEIASWETETFPPDLALPPTHATCKIWRKGVERPVIYTAVYSEWKVGTNPNWVTRPRHMLGIRALKQAARQLIHGLPFDEDEKKIAEMVNVTDTAGAEPPKRPALPPREPTTGAKAALKKAEKKADAAIETTATEVQAPVLIVKEEGAEAHTTVPDGKKLTFLCDVESFEMASIIRDGKPEPTVKAVLSGAYVGTVYHFGGAKFLGTDPDPEKDTLELLEAAWFVGRKVEVTLVGKAKRPKVSVDPQDATKKITTTPPNLVYVEAIKVHEAKAPAPASEEVD